jgi:hypothetical protein
MSPTTRAGTPRRRDGVVGHVAGHDRARRRARTRPDRHARHDRGVAADGGAGADERARQRPVRVGDEPPLVVHRARTQIVREHHPMSDEHAVFEGDPLADERVAGDLAARADHGAALDLDKRADPRVRADRAAVHVHQVAVMDDDAVSQDDV